MAEEECPEAHQRAASGPTAHGLTVWLEGDESMSVRTQVLEITYHVACNHHEDQTDCTRDILKAVDEYLAEKGFEE